MTSQHRVFRLTPKQSSDLLSDFDTLELTHIDDEEIIYCKVKKTIHVIEYSAYESARAKIARLEAALQRCKEQRDQVHLQFWDDVCPEWVFEQDNAELDAILKPEQER